MEVGKMYSLLLISFAVGLEFHYVGVGMESP